MVVFTACALLALAQGQDRMSSITGDVRYVESFHSKVLGNTRTLRIWLPPHYEEERNRRYPVLYMHDGQNVFDGKTSYIPNMEWRADEAAQGLIRAGLIEPIIIVAIDNGGVERGNEFLPTKATVGKNTYGGKANLYGQMLLTEIKPMIDGTYRTKPDAANTGLCGSSFGGIITYYLGITHPGAFSKLAIVSPSVWWDNRWAVHQALGLKKKLPLKMWIDIGTSEGPGSVGDTDALVKALTQKGWKPGKDLAYVVDGFAKHNEEAWSRRMMAILMYLFPAR